MNPSAASFPRHDPALLDRWLDGLTTPEEEAALVRAVEADPAATAALVEALLLEAELRPALAPAAARPVVLRPRFLSGARKWFAAGAAAACVAAAGWWSVQHFSAPAAHSGIAVHEASGGRLKVTRYSGGEHPAPRNWPAVPVRAADGPLTVKRYEVSWNWPADLMATTSGMSITGRLGAVGTEPLNAKPATPEESLATQLRWNGVAMPEGSWVRRTALPETELELCTTTAGHQRMEEIAVNDGLRKYQPALRVQPWLYLAPLNQPLPEPLASERIAQRQEIEKLMLYDGMHRQRSCIGKPESEWCFVFAVPLEETSAKVQSDVERWINEPASTSAPLMASPVLQLDARAWRTGAASVFLTGACGPPPDAQSLPGGTMPDRVFLGKYGQEGVSTMFPANVPTFRMSQVPPLLAEETDIAFDLTLRDEEVAVLHAGTLPDGRRCLLLLEAAIVSDYHVQNATEGSPVLLYDILERGPRKKPLFYEGSHRWPEVKP
jgi:hypothetical protein